MLGLEFRVYIYIIIIIHSCWLAVTKYWAVPRLAQRVSEGSLAFAGGKSGTGRGSNSPVVQAEICRLPPAPTSSHTISALTFVETNFAVPFLFLQWFRWVIMMNGTAWNNC